MRGISRWLQWPNSGRVTLVRLPATMMKASFARLLTGSVTAMLCTACSSQSDDGRHADSRHTTNVSGEASDHLDPIIGQWARDPEKCSVSVSKVSAARSGDTIYSLDHAALSCSVDVAPVAIGGSFHYPLRCREGRGEKLPERLYYSLNSIDRLVVRYRAPGHDDEVLRWCGPSRLRINGVVTRKANVR